MFSRENTAVMTPKDLRKHLIDADLTGAQLARDLGVSKQMVSLTLTGRRENPWIRRELASRLGMTYREMWGEDDPGTERGQRPPSAVTASVDTSTERAGGRAA